MILWQSLPLVTPRIRRGLVTATVTPRFTSRFHSVFAHVVGGWDANEWIIEGINVGDMPLLLKTSAYPFAQLDAPPPLSLTTVILKPGVPITMRARRTHGKGTCALVVSVSMTPYEWLFYCQECGASGILLLGKPIFKCARCEAKLNWQTTLDLWQ